MERTLVIIKPDAIQRQLAGKIISRFEEKGLQVVAAKFMRISQELGKTHYSDHLEKPFFPSLLKYMTSGPVMVLVLQADGIIPMVRKLMGATFGCDAEPGTIRGDFGGSKGFNLVHGSDSPEAAQKEIKLFFKDDEVIDYDLANSHWIYGSGD